MPRDVRIALAYMRREALKAINLSDLARLCSVSERTLHRHFVAFIGEPPLEHFRRTRLAAAREALLTPATEHATVAEIATRFGFAHLGRFSMEYQRHFNEAPSATLARGRVAVLAERRQRGSLPCPARRRDVAVVAVVRFRVDVGSVGLLDFADALVQQLAAGLSQSHSFAVHHVRVAPGEREARALGVRYCLTGQVTRLPNGTVRVVAHLRDLLEDNRHLWGDAHDGSFDDLASLERRVVDAVVSGVQPGIESAEIERARDKPASDLRSGDLVEPPRVRRRLFCLGHAARAAGSSWVW